MRIAWVGPVSPCRAGQARHSELLLAELGNHAAIELFLDGYRPENAAIRRRFAYFHHDELPSRYQPGLYEAVIYQLGNNPYHLQVLDLLPAVPGIIDLHDVGLQDLFALRPSQPIRDLRGLLAHARGVITHSAFQYRHVFDAADMPVATFALPSPAPGIFADDAVRALRGRLRLPANAFVVASFGFAHPFKRLHVALCAFAHFATKVPEAFYVHVGTLPPGLQGYWDEIVRAVPKTHARDRVRVTGWVTDEEMEQYAACTDVCINLRYPSNGEVSATGLLCMGAGTPVLITPVDSFCDWPDDICIKIPTGHGEVFTATTALLDLWQDPVRRRALGARAWAYVRSHHAPDRVAQQYLEFIKHFPPQNLESAVPCIAAAVTEVRCTVGQQARLPLAFTTTAPVQMIRAQASRGRAFSVQVELLTGDGRSISPNWARVRLPIGIHLGETLAWETLVDSPAQPGQYVLAIRVEGELGAAAPLRVGPAISLPLLVLPADASPHRLHATIQGPSDAIRCQPGAAVTVPVCIHNSGDAVWRSGVATEHGVFNLGGHLWSAHRGRHVRDFVRVPLPRDMAPGATETVACAFTAPDAPGSYVVVLDMVVEGVAWFETSHSPVAMVCLEVSATG